jgi:hypothetical protein
MSSNMMSINNEILTRQGDRLHEAMGIWNEGIRNIKMGYLSLGHAINLLKQDRIWRLMGNHILSWKHFCDNELHCSIAQANRLELIYRELGHVLTDITIDIGKVTLLLPYLSGKTEEEKKDILESNKDLSMEAIRNNLLEEKGKGEYATDVCLHTEYDTFCKCKKCNKVFK